MLNVTLEFSIVALWDDLVWFKKPQPNPGVLLRNITAELHIHNEIMLVVIANLMRDCHLALLVTIENDTVSTIFKAQMKQKLLW